MSVALLVRAFFWLWFAGAVAAGHWLVLQRLPLLAVPATILALSGAVVTLSLRIPCLRSWVDAIDLRALVLLHASRLVGLYFLILYQRGDLPREFAVSVGMGEIVVAVMTFPVVFAPLDEGSRRRAIRIWNIVGLIGMLLVVFTVARLGLTSPLSLRTFTQLPLSLYPTFLMPLLIATHVIMLQRVAPTQPLE